MKPRLRSLDVFRGITVALMILVNNPGSWSAMYPPLQHASWHGCTPTDLVFPFFLFAVGNSLAIVLPRLDQKGDFYFWVKISKRVALIFAIGVFLNMSPFVRWDTSNQLALKEFDSLRFLGVLQRIALAFGFAAAIVWLCNGSKMPKLVLGVASLLLVGYWLSVLLLAKGSDPYSLEGFYGTGFDRWILGPKHLYNGEGVPFDPEGLVSTIPSIAQVLLGWWVGKQLLESQMNAEITTRLFVLGGCLLFLAYLWQLGFPLNKKIWSSSFVLWTTGLAIFLLSTLVHWLEGPSVDLAQDSKEKLVDKKSFALNSLALFRNTACRILEAFGKNPLFIFVLSGLIPRCLGLLRWQSSVDVAGNVSWTSPLPWAFKSFFANLSSDARLGSFAYSLALLSIYAGIVVWMDNRKIYVRV